MSNKPEFELGKTDDVVSALPIPARNVEKVGLVVVLKTQVF